MLFNEDPCAHVHVMNLDQIQVRTHTRYPVATRMEAGDAVNVLFTDSNITLFAVLAYLPTFRGADQVELQVRAGISPLLAGSNRINERALGCNKNGDDNDDDDQG